MNDFYRQVYDLVAQIPRGKSDFLWPDSPPFMPAARGAGGGAGHALLPAGPALAARGDARRAPSPPAGILRCAAKSWRAKACLFCPMAAWIWSPAAGCKGCFQPLPLAGYIKRRRAELAGTVPGSAQKRCAPHKT